MKLLRRLFAAVGLAGAVQAGPVAADAPRDCMALRLEHGWSRAEFRECKLEEANKRIALMKAEFERMRTWLQARGLDLDDTGHIIDPQGRTLATIEAQNTQLEQSNANLEQSNANLEQSNAALRATLNQLRLDNQQLDDEYAEILSDFGTFLNENAN